MAIEHDAISDGERHEPKGISSATVKQVYTSDGIGSGSWQNSPLGWEYYQHGSTGQVITSTYSKIQINGLGSLTSKAFAPRDIRGTATQLWDTTNFKITPVNVGDAYDFRLDIPVTAESGSPVEATLQLDIGGGATPTIVILERYIATGKAVPYTITVGFTLLALTSLTVNNGIQLFLKTNTGTMTLGAPAVTLVQNFRGTD